MPRSTDSDTSTQPTPDQRVVDTKPQVDQPTFYPSITQESLMVEAIRRVESKRRNQVPGHVGNLQISKRVFTNCGIDWLVLKIWFDDASDPLFAGAIVWVKGYGTQNGLGEPNVSDLGRQDTLSYHAMTIVNHSPAFLIMIPTNEKIVVGVESINNEGVGAGLTNMPTQSFMLSTT